jgi:hypothetical protein
MPGITDRHVVRAVALTMAAVAGAALLALSSGASAAPLSTTRTTGTTGSTGTVAGVTLRARTTTLPFRHRTARATTPRRAAAADVELLPLWSSSFRYPSEHKTYPFTMVGTDPSKDEVTTTLANTLTPVSLTFADKHVAAPSPALVRQMRLTGLYSDQSFPGGRGQYGDVYLRTQFWSALSDGTKNWHVTMATPAVEQQLLLTVPANKGGRSRLKNGQTLYLVDVEWFDSQLLSRVDAASAAELTQFLGGEVVLCGTYSARDVSSCGIGGYHSGVDATDGPHTYLYASYLDPKYYGTASGFYKLSPFSHELAEWLTDPLVTNAVPKWTQPDVPQYGCSSLLEVGDPLIGKNVAVGTQVYQDEAYLPFFSRPKTSMSWNHRYSWFANLKRSSRAC